MHRFLHWTTPPDLDDLTLVRVWDADVVAEVVEGRRRVPEHVATGIDGCEAEKLDASSTVPCLGDDRALAAADEQPLVKDADDGGLHVRVQEGAKAQRLIRRWRKTCLLPSE